MTSAVVRAGFPGGGTPPRIWKQSRGARQAEGQLWETVSTRDKKEKRLTSLTSSSKKEALKSKQKVSILFVTFVIKNQKGV